MANVQGLPNGTPFGETAMVILILLYFSVNLCLCKSLKFFFATTEETHTQPCIS